MAQSRTLQGQKDKRKESADSPFLHTFSVFRRLTSSPTRYFFMPSSRPSPLLTFWLGGSFGRFGSHPAVLDGPILRHEVRLTARRDIRRPSPIQDSPQPTRAG